jgi:hypothetical protein
VARLSRFGLTAEGGSNKVLASEGNSENIRVTIRMLTRGVNTIDRDRTLAVQHPSTALAAESPA